MRILIQRVRKASVIIEDNVHAQIEQGLLIFVGIHYQDTVEHAKWLANKCIALRLFDDSQGKMNLSIEEIKGEILIVSQFTLYGNCMAGRRPEFTQAAKGNSAHILYQAFVHEVTKLYPKVKTGIFAAAMQIDLINDGPVTFMIVKSS